MKQDKVKVEMHVVINDLDDATIYTVREIEGFRVRLCQPLSDGSEVFAGWIDVSYLKIPTLKQIVRNKSK